MFGFVLIVVGLVFLLKNLGIIYEDVWPIIWPCLLMVIGLSALLKRRKREEKWEKFGEGMRKFGEEVHKVFNEKKGK